VKGIFAISGIAPPPNPSRRVGTGSPKGDFLISLKNELLLLISSRAIFQLSAFSFQLSAFSFQLSAFSFPFRNYLKSFE
jgi:hypothetical protein